MVLIGNSEAPAETTAESNAHPRTIRKDMVV